MLLKAGYRHVYISRQFAQKHGFIPKDAAPGHYGYGGLVNIGTWPITLNPMSSGNTTPVGTESGKNHGGVSTTLVSPSGPANPEVPGLGVRRRGSMSSTAASLVRSNSRGSQRTATRKSKRGAKDADHQGVPEGRKVINIPVYLSEEPHFDVVLGRSFIERRQIKTNVIDPTDVVCLDTGEKIECELVILKDGKGEIVTVT
jgi:hypothetical protein